MPIEQSRGEYLQALLQQRKQLQANNSGLLNPSVPNDIEQQTQFNTNMNNKSSVTDIPQPQETDTSGDNWFVSLINKANGIIQNMANSFLYGVGGAFEGIMDLGANIVAGIGDATGWYDTSGITDFVKHDYAKDFADFNTDFLGYGSNAMINLIKNSVKSGGQNWADAFTDISSYKDKYTNELYGIEGLNANRNVDNPFEEFSMGIAQSIGFMLPSIVLGQYGGQAASLTSMGLSAAGKGAEEALQEGATSGQALGYGALSGAAEVASEIVVGKALKVAGLGTGKVFGLIGKKGIETTAKLGTKAFVKELAQNFIEEGLEEVSTAVLEPLFKATYKGTSEFDKYKSSDFWFGTNGHFNESVLGQFTSGGVTAGITGGAVKIVNKATVTKKVGADGYKVAQVYHEMMENDSELLRQKKGSKAYNDLVNSGAQLQSQYIEAMDKFLQNSTESQKKEMAKMLGDPREYAKFMTTENENINENVKDYLTNLSKINADTNKRISRNFVNEMQDRFGTDYTIEFDEVKDSKGKEQYAYVDKDNKVIRINDKMVAEKGGALLAHEYFGHVLGQNISSGTRQALFNSIKDSNWYKTIEKDLVREYQINDNTYNSLDSQAKKNTYYQDEVIAKYLEEVFGKTNTIESVKHLKKVFSQPTLIDRILDVFNKSRNQFNTPNIIKEYAKVINKTINALYNINKNNTLLKALYKEKHNYKLTTKEEQIKREYKNLFDIIKENKSQPQLAYSKDTNNVLNKDSDGNELSKQQQKFFANTKVRDEEGNLLVVYHGTNAEFSEFNPQKDSTQANREFNGNFFAEKEASAKNYGNKAMKVYLNIEKPLNIDAKESEWNRIEFSDLDDKTNTTYIDKNTKLPFVSKEEFMEFKKRVDDYWEEESNENYINAYYDYLEKHNTYTDAKNILNNLDKATIFDVISLMYAYDRNNAALDLLSEYNVDDIYDNDFKEELINSIIADMQDSENENYSYEDLIKDFGNYKILTLNPAFEIKQLHSTREIVAYALNSGNYDGVIFNNIYDKTDGLDNVFVTFNSNQSKDVNNLNPTDNPDIRYSKNLEEVTDLSQDNNAVGKPKTKATRNTYKSIETTKDVLDLIKSRIVGDEYNLAYPSTYRDFMSKTFTELNKVRDIDKTVDRIMNLLKETTVEYMDEETKTYKQVGKLSDNSKVTAKEWEALRNDIKRIIQYAPETEAKNKYTLEFEARLNKLTEKTQEYGERIGRTRVLNNRLNRLKDRIGKFYEVTEDEIAKSGLKTLYEPFMQLEGSEKGFKAKDFKNNLNKVLEWYNEENIGDNFETLPYNPNIRAALEDLYESLGEPQEYKIKAGTPYEETRLKTGNLDTNQMNKVIDVLNLIDAEIKKQTRVSIENRTYANATAKVMMNKKDIKGLAKAIKMWKRGFAPAYTLVREMLGGNSPLARLLTTDISNATSNNTMYKGQYFDNLKAEMKKLGIKQSNLNKRIQVKDVELTTDMALYLYISLNTDTNYNEINANGFEYVDKNKKSKTFGIGEADLYKEELEKVLPENIRKMGDYLQKFMNTEMKADYMKWFESRFGKYEGRNEIGRIGDTSYWMLNRSYQYATSAEKVVKSPAGVFKRALSRKGSNNAILLGGALSSVTTYIEQLGTEIYLKPIYRQAYQVLNTKVNDTTIYKMLLEADTKDVKYLETTLNDIIGVKEFKNNDILSKMMSTFSVAKLSLNIGSMMKQFASIYTSNIPLRKSIKAQLTRAFNKTAKTEFRTLVDEIGALKYREGVNPVLEANAGKLSGITETIANVGMYGIKKMDFFTIGVGVYSLMQIGQDQFGYKIGTQENIDFVKQHYNEFDISQISNNPLSKNAVSRGDVGQLARLVFGFLQGANRAAFGSQITKIGLWKRNHNVDKASIQNRIKELKNEIKTIENENLNANNEFDSINLEDDVRENYITLQSELMQNQDALKDYEAYEVSGGKNIPLHMVSGLVAQGIFVAFINELMKHIKGKKDWDEWDIAEFGLDVSLATAVDWLPFVNVISNMIKGHEVTIPAVEIMNEAVDIINNAKSGNWQTMIRQLALLIGDTTGIPFQTLYQYMYGTIKSFNPEIAYQMNSVLYGTSSQSTYNTLNKYVERNNSNGVKSMINVLMDSYKVKSNESVNNELSRLYMNGYNNSIPKGYLTQYTNDKGETIELTSKQIEEFRSYYNQATKSVNELINITDYKNLTDEDKAKIIKKIYDAYYSMAKAKTLNIKADSRLGNYLLYSKQNANIGKISLVLGNISNITDSKTKTRKELVFDYVNRLKGYSRAEKLLILYLAGYTSSANDTTLRNYLLNTGMTRNQIKEFLG